MGIAPVQPENLASAAMYSAAQAAVFGDGAPGWNLAAYQAVGLAAVPGAGGAWPVVRMTWGFSVAPAAVSRSRVGAFSSAGLQSDARDARHARRIRVCLPALLTGQGGTHVGNTIDPGDGLGPRVLVMKHGDRLVVPASVLRVEGVDGDAVIAIESAVSDGAVWVGEGRF